MSSDLHSPVDHAAVRDRIDNVHDPELDRSIVELEYIEDVQIEGEHVAVRFVLPTAWCSPAFAWMMATGIRDEVRALPGVESVHVELLDHMHDDEINQGVNEDLPFQAVFEDAEDDLSEVRAKLDRKARLVRQYHAVEHLLDAGLDPDQIVALTPADLDHSGDRMELYLLDEAVGVSVDGAPIREYLEKAREVDVVTDNTDPLFADLDGEPIAPADFDAVHREARLAKTTMDGQAGLCSGLHEARNGVELNGD